MVDGSIAPIEGASQDDCRSTGRIYVLCDPTDGAIRYCGATMLPLPARLRWHIANTLNRRRSGCGPWVSDLVDAGMLPLIREIEVCSKRMLHVRERYWIARLMSEGHVLLNKASGGPGSPGSPRDEAWRAAHGAAARRMWQSPEIRERLVGSLRARWQDPEWVAAYREAYEASSDKRIAALRQATQDTNWRAKVSEAGKRAWADPEIRARRMKAIRSPDALAKRAEVARRCGSQPGRALRKLTFEDAERIRVMRESGKTYRELAEVFGTNISTVFRIVKGLYYIEP